jgi:hypothetical protein
LNNEEWRTDLRDVGMEERGVKVELMREEERLMMKEKKRKEK